MSPAASGALLGAVGGAAALGVVHLLATERLLAPIAAAASTRGVDVGVSLAVAYVTAAALGAIVGTGFAVVTRYLRKWFPLLVWALVFFTSLALLILAFAKVGPLAAPILLASAVYGAIVSVSLPIRRRA